MEARGTMMEAAVAEEDNNLTEEEKAAHMRQRKCTDFLCVPVFMASLAAAACVLHHAVEHGDIRRVYHGLDFQSQLCGVDAAVRDKPLLYWCTQGGNAMDAAALANAGIPKVFEGADGHKVDLVGLHAVLATSGSLDLKHPICVSECPTSASTFSSCFIEETVKDHAKDVTGTFWRNVTFHFGFVEDHPSYPVAGRYCMPQESALLEQLHDTMTAGHEAVMFYAAEVLESWQLLAANAVFAFILGYLYLWLVKVTAGPVIYGSLGVSALLSLGFGLYVLLGVFSEDIDAQFVKHFDRNTDLTSVYVPSTGYKTWDIVIAVACLVVGLAIAIGACCMRQSIDLVLGALEATLECLKDMPLLLIQPTISVLFRLAYICAALVGLAWVLSLGDVAQYNVSSLVPAGVARSFDYEQEELFCVAVFVFVALWVLELFNALDQFVFAYATQMWFFAPYKNGRKSVSVTSLIRGAGVGLTYHLGTIAFGSLLLACFRALYLVLSLVYNQVKSSDDEKRNNVVAAAAGCCMCCLKCWESMVRYLNKNVYIVVSVNSTGFCASAEVVLQIIASEFKALGLLEGVTKVFQAAGLITITGTGGYVTWLVLRDVPTFSEPTSEHFVAQPLVVTGAACCICAAIALVFMNIFDVVSDTILVCWALDKKWRKEHNLGENKDLPPRLRALLAKVMGEQNNPLIG